MRKFAFVTRHQPTTYQFTLAQAQGIELIPVGDRDAFTFNPREFAGDFEGIICVHPWMALKAIQAGLDVGVFENANRAPEGEKPSFEAIALHVTGA